MKTFLKFSLIRENLSWLDSISILLMILLFALWDCSIIPKLKPNLSQDCQTLLEWSTLINSLKIHSLKKNWWEQFHWAHITIMSKWETTLLQKCSVMEKFLETWTCFMLLFGTLLKRMRLNTWNRFNLIRLNSYFLDSKILRQWLLSQDWLSLWQLRLVQILLFGSASIADT